MLPRMSNLLVLPSYKSFAELKPMTPHIRTTTIWLLSVGFILTATAQAAPPVTPLPGVLPPAEFRNTIRPVAFDDGVPSPPKTGDAKKKESDDDKTVTAKEFNAALKRITSLEKENDELKEDYDDIEAAAKKKKADAAKKPSFRINGRIHADTWSFIGETPGIGFFEHPDPTAANFGASPEDRWVFRRIRLEMRGDILQTMGYKLDVDFNNPGRPEYKDLYIAWTELPRNQTLRLGNQKRPIGLDHLNSSRFNVFAERPQVVETFNEDARRMGLQMLGHTDDESRFWQYGVYNLENTSRDGRAIGDALQLSGNVRTGGSPWYDETSNGRGYFHWAVSGMFAKPDGNPNPGATNANEGRFRTRPEARSDSRWLDTGRIAGVQAYETMGLEAMLNLGSLQFTSEYQANWTQRAGAPDLFFQGAYVQASYFLTGEHITYNRTYGVIGRVTPFENFFLVDRCRGGRGWGMGAWQIAARASYLDLTDENITGGVGRNMTLGLNWHWTPYSKVQTNYIYGNIDNRGPIGGFTSGSYHIIGSRFMVDF